MYVTLFSNHHQSEELNFHSSHFLCEAPHLQLQKRGISLKLNLIESLKVLKMQKAFFFATRHIHKMPPAVTENEDMLYLRVT